MNKYEPLWNWIQENGTDSFKLTFDEIEKIADLPIDHSFFRDYLNEHPAVAKEYEALKLRLWRQYEHNRDAYTDAKTNFISKWTAEARKEYGDRY